MTGSINNVGQPSVQVQSQAPVANNAQTLPEVPAVVPQDIQNPQMVDAQTYISQLPKSQGVGFNQPSETQQSLVQQETVATDEQPKTLPVEEPNTIDDPIINDWPRYMPQNNIYGPKPYAMPTINIVEGKQHPIMSDKVAIYTGAIASTLATIALIIAHFRR